MTLQSAALDLELLEAAARAAGALARELRAKPLEVQSKGELGPVTNIDLAVDALLTERLLNERPDYGWLSEEAPDDVNRRIGKARTFMLDPIDGTQALVDNVPQWTISIGIVEGERAFAGVVYNPMTDELFLGAPGVSATLNGKPIQTTTRYNITNARMLGYRNRFADRRWPTPWPKPWARRGPGRPRRLPCSSACSSSSRPRSAPNVRRGPTHWHVRVFGFEVSLALISPLLGDGAELQLVTDSGQVPRIRADQKRASALCALGLPPMPLRSPTYRARQLP